MRNSSSRRSTSRPHRLSNWLVPVETPFRLSDFSDKVVTLNFIVASCTDFCPLHSELIAEVQKKVNDVADEGQGAVPQRSRRTRPRTLARCSKATARCMGWMARNWMFLTTKPSQPEDTTRKLSEEYDVRFEPLDGGQQMHGIVTHVIDRGGRFAAKFHGMRFDPLNMVLYVNGLTNNVPKPGKT